MLQAENQFKAKELNRKILSGVSKLPEVLRKERTEFKEFMLSKPMPKSQKENAESILPTHASFKAKTVNHRILKEASFKP